MTDKNFKILVYGYGNPGRQDDGLGYETARIIEAGNYNNVISDYNYQLNVEDAVALSDTDAVIFVDASTAACEPFEFYKIEAEKSAAFTTHSMSPESVLSICRDVYSRQPLAYVLAIRGYEWELIEGLTDKAAENLTKACEFLNGLLSSANPASLDSAAVKLAGCAENCN